MENTILGIHSNIMTVCSRLQLQGERAGGGTSTEYRGMVRTALGIAREEVSTAGVENRGSTEGWSALRWAYPGRR